MSAVGNVCHLFRRKSFSKMHSYLPLYYIYKFSVLVDFYLISTVIKLKSVEIIFQTIFEYKVERFGPCKNTSSM